jgi:predicted Zn-dependent peptidase
MLFKGTPRRSARRIAEEMDAVGGNLNAMTDKESTCFYAHVVDRHLPRPSTCWRTCSALAVRRRRAAQRAQVVLEEIKMYDDSPDEVVHDLFARTLWRGANLGDPTIGFAHTVARDRPRRPAEWRASATRRDRVRHGGRQPRSRRLVRLASAKRSGVQGQRRRARYRTAALHAGGRRAHRRHRTGLRAARDAGSGMRDERRYTLSVLDTILGGGMSSRLFQKCARSAPRLRDRDVPAGVSRAGLFGVSAGCTPERVQECVDVIVDEIDRLLDGGVHADEVERAREHLKGNMTLALESTFNRMSRLARNEFVHGRQISTEEVEAAFDAVDVAGVNGLARELFGPAQRGLCVLGPGAVRGVRLRGVAAA